MPQTLDDRLTGFIARPLADAAAALRRPTAAAAGALATLAQAIGWGALIALLAARTIPVTPLALAGTALLAIALWLARRTALLARVVLAFPRLNDHHRAHIAGGLAGDAGKARLAWLTGALAAIAGHALAGLPDLVGAAGLVLLPMAAAQYVLAFAVDEQQAMAAAAEASRA